MDPKISTEDDIDTVVKCRATMLTNKFKVIQNHQTVHVTQ